MFRVCSHSWHHPETFLELSHTEQYLRWHSASTWKKAAFLKGCLKMVRKMFFLFSHEMHPFHGDQHNQSSAHGEQSWSGGTSLWSSLFQEFEEQCLYEQLYCICELWSYQGKKHSVCISATLQIPWATPNLHTGNWRKKQNSLCGSFKNIWDLFYPSTNTPTHKTAQSKFCTLCSCFPD